MPLRRGRQAWALTGGVLVAIHLCDGLVARGHCYQLSTTIERDTDPVGLDHERIGERNDQAKRGIDQIRARWARDRQRSVGRLNLRPARDQRRAVTQALLGSERQTQVGVLDREMLPGVGHLENAADRARRRTDDQLAAGLAEPGRSGRDDRSPDASMRSSSARSSTTCRVTLADECVQQAADLGCVGPIELALDTEHHL